MKIGIITLPPSFNYGNILQAWALQTILERMGNNVTIVIGEPIHYKIPVLKIPFIYLNRFIHKYICGKKNLLVFEEKAKMKMYQYTECFIQQHLHICKFSSFYDINESDFDAFVVGSDQIWRKRYNRDITTRYLSFAKEWRVKRVAYAASFGTSIWEYTDDETMECSKLLRLFDGISVREKNGVDLIKEKFHQDALHVLDPTLLLNKEDYLILLESKSVPHSDGDLLCYFLEDYEEKEKIARQYALEHELKPFKVYSKHKNPNLPIEQRIQPPVESWLRGFYDAKMVITDSFHATVFSIIFKKPFMLLNCGQRGNERLESVLQMVGFETENGIFNKKFVVTENNRNRLIKKREESMAFLKHFLCDNL